MSTVYVAGERAASHGRFSVLRRAFSFPVMLSSLLSVLAVLTVRSRFDDPDMWWHLKTGEIIWTGHTIPTKDIFSYTTNHHAWIPHEWLSQVVIYGAYRFGGYSGLMVWLCFFAVALLIAGYALCSLYSTNAKVGFLGAMVIWFFATTGLAVRPQMVGYLLLTIELLLVQLGRTRDPRWFFALVPLFAVWVNCHGSFFLGLIVGAIFLLCSCFEFQIGPLMSVRWDRRHRRMLAWALALSAAALFLNPVGVNQVLYPLDTMLHQHIQLGNVEEWMPLQINSVRGLGLLGVLGSIVLLVIARRSELFFDELVILVLGMWLAISHQRMLFVFGILAAPVFSRLLSKSWDGYDPAQDRPLPNAVLIAISLAIIFWGFPNRQDLTAQVDQRSPVKAVEFIKTSHLSGNYAERLWLWRVSDLGSTRTSGLCRRSR